MANKYKASAWLRRYFHSGCAHRGRQSTVRSELSGGGKAARQRRWSATGERRLLQRPEHVERVRTWRAAIRGTGLPSSCPSVALQDALALQVIETPEDLVRRALQDALRCQGPVLIGLIAHLSDSALQDDIASTTRGLLQPAGHPLGSKTHAPQTSAAPERLRQVPPQFSWIDQRLVPIGTLSAATCRRSRCICVGHRRRSQGLSYYGEQA